jgi:sirohydrochlorin cobaltochelatase
MGREIFAVLQGPARAPDETLAVPDPHDHRRVLLGRGSSDAGANGELAKMARWIFEDNEHELVDLAFTGVTWPRLETVVQRQVKLGMTQICIVPVYLFTGVLIERIKAQVERLQQQYPQIAFALGTALRLRQGHFRPARRKVGRELPKAGMLECDGCKYREAAEAEHLHDHSHTAVLAGISGLRHGHQHGHDHGA